MARVTVEDCIVHVPNRFDLLLLSAQRAKQISSGSPITVERDNDKDSVISLREIADQTVSLDDIREDFINSFCKRQSAELAEKKIAEQLLSDPANEIEEAFADAGQHIRVADDDDAPEGMSFEDENLDVED